MQRGGATNNALPTRRAVVTVVFSHRMRHAQAQHHEEQPLRALWSESLCHFVATEPRCILRQAAVLCFSPSGSARRARHPLFIASLFSLRPALVLLPPPFPPFSPAYVRLRANLVADEIARADNLHGKVALHALGHGALAAAGRAHEDKPERGRVCTREGRGGKGGQRRQAAVGQVTEAGERG